MLAGALRFVLVSLRLPHTADEAIMLAGALRREPRGPRGPRTGG